MSCHACHDNERSPKITRLCLAACLSWYVVLERRWNSEAARAARCTPPQALEARVTAETETAYSHMAVMQCAPPLMQVLSTRLRVPPASSDDTIPITTPRPPSSFTTEIEPTTRAQKPGNRYTAIASTVPPTNLTTPTHLHLGRQAA